MPSEAENARADAGRALFREGEWAAALGEFKQCVGGGQDSEEDKVFHANMLGNCAQCCLNLDRKTDAAEFATASLAVDPSKAKAHYRLAEAISGTDLEKAFMHICCAAALQQATTSGLAAQVKDLFERLRNQLKEATGPGQGKAPTVFQEKESRMSQLALLLPDNVAKVRIVGSAGELQRAFTSHQMIVLRPGFYADTWLNADAIDMRGGKRRWLLGLSEEGVILGKGHAHVLGSVSLRHVIRVDNLTVSDDRRQRTGACFCCAGGTQMMLRHVLIKGCGDSAALCADEEAVLRVEDCVFEDIPSSQAVEVREGGSAVVLRTHIRKCRQGLSIYGGAKDVLLRSVVVQQTAHEGLFFEGALENAATRQQKAFLPDSHANQNEFAKSVADYANLLAQETGLAGKLRALVEGCTIESAGTFGSTCDHGATVVFRGCIFKKCMQKGVLIKGATDVSMAKCAFVENRTALEVGVNYGGDVRIEEPSLCKNKNDIVDEANTVTSAQKVMMKRMGMWSKPMVVVGKRSVAKATEIAAASELLAACEAQDDVALDAEDPPKRHVAPPLTGTSFSPARMGPIDEQPEYYAIGNTPGFDLLQDIGEKRQHFRVLLGACGDVRNVVETVCGWWRRQGVADDGASLTVVLNDRSASILVRDLVLLELFRTSTSRCVAEVWGCLGVRPDFAAAVSEVLEKMRTLSDSGGWADFMPFYDGAAASCDVAQWRADMKVVVDSWRQCPLTLEEVRAKRVQLRGYSLDSNVDISVGSMLGKLSAHQQRAAAADKPTAGRKSEKRPSVSDDVKKQVRSYLSGHLVVGKKGTALNPTMLEAPFLQPESLYPTSSIYRATGEQDPFGYIEDQIHAMRAALDSGRIRVRIASCDIFGLLREAGEAQDGEAPYDVADFSNVADYVGPANILALGGRVAGKRLFMQQMRTAKMFAEVGDTCRSEAEAWLLQALGCGRDTFAALAGVKLVDVQCRYMTSVVHTVWQPISEGECVKVSEKNFFQLASHYCFMAGPPDSKWAGSGHHSPATLALFRRGFWLQKYESALLQAYPLFRASLALAHGNNALCKARCDVDYYAARSAVLSNTHVVAAALVVDTSAFKRSDVAMRSLPEEARESVATRKRGLDGGLKADVVRSLAKAIVHQVFCDFDERSMYFVLPLSFFKEEDVSSCSLVYALEWDHGFLPLSALIALSSVECC
mmetsp:Transcript_39033/g.112113  ORF Transcript_39033/g.112113 Transcript_39033/m.112113 type:complete len:1194 (+) Transcript_39033:82-3663(+)